MNQVYKCFLSLLLIVMVSAKVVTPVMQLYKSSSLQSDIEQQEQKTSEENNAEKTDAEKAAGEVAELAFVQRFLSSHATICLLYNSYFVSLLPSRYFAVPTPPPWYTC